MERNYGVSFGNRTVGKVQVLRQGLYYVFHCRCRIPGEDLCRLTVCCGQNSENLGVLVPMDGGFGLDTKVSVKRLGTDEMSFLIHGKKGPQGGTFVPIYPEEPFAYIEKLKELYLIRKNGQPGVLI